MSTEQEQHYDDFMFQLDDLYNPKVVYAPDKEKVKKGQSRIDSAFEEDKKALKEIYEELHGKPSRINLTPEMQKIVSVIESEITLKKIRDYFDRDRKPLGRDFYASITLVLDAEPVHIDFTDARENKNIINIDDPGRKLFWIEIINGSNPIQYSLNRSRDSRTMISTLAASGTKKYEADTGVIESITLKALSGGNSTITIYGFY